MDSHFHAYKARYEILDEHLRLIATSQYVRDMDIFINLDDLFHIMHRPQVEKEVEACGINAIKQCAVHIINLAAHYKQWTSKRHIKSRIFLVYTTNLKDFKNRVYLPSYREHHELITDPLNSTFFMINDTISKAIPIAKNVTDYVDSVFMVDSHYLEPSILPLFLSKIGVADYSWKMMVSRDQYDYQYAYKDRWIFVSPKGDNTRVITRNELWSYIAYKERINTIDKRPTLFDHDLYPLALAVNGNRLRSIPRLKRVGWKTIFSYLEAITEKDSSSLQILSSRFLDLLIHKGVSISQIENNLSCVSIPSQVDVLGDIDKTSITDQLKYVSDHEALATINDMYFQDFPINIPFLISDYKNGRPFYG